MAGVASSSSSSSEDLTQQPADSGFNQLIQRRRCELMYELKRLQHSERPVTGSESRDKVDSFFSKRLQRSDNPSHVANTDDVEEHRPEHVVVEVQGLLQRRSVSAVLQSEGFRRSLENVVRNRVGRTPARQRATESSSLVSQPVTSSVTTSPAVRESADTTTSSSTPFRRSVTVTSRPTESPSPAQESSVRGSTDTNLPSDSNQELRPLLSNVDDRRDPTTLSPAEQMRSLNHEQLVMEISELVHRQLVSSALSGNIRDRLESHVLRRVNDAGHDGRAVQEQILNLPPSNIVRNDFSHLGLLPPTQQDLDDAVSVISATASATIPYVQSNAAVNRELAAMKSQISQLSNMLKMSLDLQMDIQRSIRQEVAAAVSQATAGATGVAPLPVSRAADSKCIVCIDGDADAVLYRCGHICMCYSCALRMKSSNGSCPVCRAPINDIVRAYRISHE